MTSRIDQNPNQQKQFKDSPLPTSISASSTRSASSIQRSTVSSAYSNVSSMHISSSLASKKRGHNQIPAASRSQLPHVANPGLSNKGNIHSSQHPLPPGGSTPPHHNNTFLSNRLFENSHSNKFLTASISKSSKHNSHLVRTTSGRIISKSRSSSALKNQITLDTHHQSMHNGIFNTVTDDDESIDTHSSKSVSHSPAPPSTNNPPQPRILFPEVARPKLSSAPTTTQATRSPSPLEDIPTFSSSYLNSNMMDFGNESPLYFDGNSIYSVSESNNMPSNLISNHSQHSPTDSEKNNANNKFEPNENFNDETHSHDDPQILAQKIRGSISSTSPSNSYTSVALESSSSSISSTCSNFTVKSRSQSRSRSKQSTSPSRNSLDSQTLTQKRKASHDGSYENKATPVFSSSWHWKTIFIISIILRTYFSLSPSYIHPDEHFQGPEAIADMIFGWATKKSWEFSSASPARSYFVAWVVYGIPMFFLKLIYAPSPTSINPQAVLHGLRLTFALGNWVLSDMAIDRLTQSKDHKLSSLFFYATSYVTWTYQSHTFSNSVETVIILWCLVIIYEFQTKTKKRQIASPARFWDGFLLGILVAFGIFNRITFPAFLFIPAIRSLPIFFKYPGTLFMAALGFSITCILAIYFDSVCFSFLDPNSPSYAQYPFFVTNTISSSSSSSIFSLFKLVSTTNFFKQHTITTSSKLVITPLNNLFYNLQTDNLALHGIHSRLHHILVNIPELMGPGILLLLSTRFIKSLPFQSAISGIFILSLVQHQEARFLLPAIPLLCCSLDVSIVPKKFRGIFFTIWIAFNVIMGVLMGILHQGGVIPAQGYLSQLTVSPFASTLSKFSGSLHLSNMSPYQRERDFGVQCASPVDFIDKLSNSEETSPAFASINGNDGLVYNNFGGSINTPKYVYYDYNRDGNPAGNLKKEKQCNAGTQAKNDIANSTGSPEVVTDYVILWWKTYSPPIWMLGKDLDDVDIIDPIESIPGGGENWARYQTIFSFLDALKSSVVGMNVNKENEKSSTFSETGERNKETLSKLDQSTKLDPAMPSGETEDSSVKQELIKFHSRHKYYSAIHPHITVVDMMGANRPLLKTVLKKLANISKTAQSNITNNNINGGINQRIYPRRVIKTYLVAPIATILTSLDSEKAEINCIETIFKTSVSDATGNVPVTGKDNNNTTSIETLGLLDNDLYKFKKVWTTKSHLSLDDLDFTNWKSLVPGLAIYEMEIK